MLSVECQPTFRRNISPSVFATWFMLASCLAYSSTLKMEATRSSEMSVYIQWNTRHCIPEDRRLNLLSLRVTRSKAGDVKKATMNVITVYFFKHNFYSKNVDLK
jgi:hypothetical protein